MRNEKVPKKMQLCEAIPLLNWHNSTEGRPLPCCNAINNWLAILFTKCATNKSHVEVKLLNFYLQNQIWNLFLLFSISQFEKAFKMILWPVKEIVTSHLVWFMGTDMPATMCAHWMEVIKTKSRGENVRNNNMAGVNRFKSKIWVRKHFQRA